MRRCRKVRKKSPPKPNYLPLWWEFMPVFFSLIMANYQVVMYTSYTVLLIRDDWVLFYYLSRFSEILMNGMCFPMVKVVTIKDISRFL